MATFAAAVRTAPRERQLALLDWLNRFTFPEERRYASPPHARAAAEAFLDRLVQHGTTAAVVFSTVHRSATDTLFTTAARRDQAIVSGKTLMNRNAPAALRDNGALRGDVHRRPAPRGGSARRAASRLPHSQPPTRKALRRDRIRAAIVPAGGGLHRTSTTATASWAPAACMRMEFISSSASARGSPSPEPPSCTVRPRTPFWVQGSSTLPASDARTVPFGWESPPTWAATRATRCFTPSARRTRWRCTAGARPPCMR